jgi:hypothetical protein
LTNTNTMLVYDMLRYCESQYFPLFPKKRRYQLRHRIKLALLIG